MRRAPIDISIAISRYFSITIITSVIRIFSAATSWISPITIIVTIRSMFSALNSCLFSSIHVVVVYFGPDRFLDLLSRISSARLRSSTLTSIWLTTSSSDNAFCAA